MWLLHNLTIVLKGSSILQEVLIDNDSEGDLEKLLTFESTITNKDQIEII